MAITHLGVVAHVDAGKTSLVERMLHHAGTTLTAGSVDQGTTQTDYMPVERRRGISVRAAAARLVWRGRPLCLIDTPGHRDFAAEVWRSLAILDAAVLCLSAVEGVEAQSEHYWHALSELAIPCLIFVNKVDRVGADVPAVVEAMRQLAGRPLVDIARPETWLAELAEGDDALAEAWIEGRELPRATLEGALAAQFAAGMVLPWLSGSALEDRGVTALLDLIAELVPQPRVDEQAAASAYVYKVEHDRRFGRLAHVRLFAGRLETRQPLLNLRTGEETKLTQIRQVSGARQHDVPALEAGDSAALAGLQDVVAGDTLGDATGLPPRLARLAPEPSLLRVRVHPGPGEDYPALLAACRELSAEEPGLALLWSLETRELLLHISGAVQGEILADALRERFGLEPTLDPPQLVYRETVARTAEAEDHYTMPKPCWAIARFRVEPLPRGSGVEYVSLAPHRRLAYRYQGQVEQTVPLVLEQGVHGWAVTDLRVTLVDGEDHPIHTHPLDFVTVTPMALRRALFEAGSVLLEPIWRYRLQLPDEDAGRLTALILSLRGTVLSDEQRGEAPQLRRILTGRIPAATSLDLPVTLARMTGGRGILSLQLDGYEPCPPGEVHESPYRGIDPLDRERYILHVRGALA